MQTATNQKEPILAREGLPFYITPVIVALIFFFLGWERASGSMFLLALAVALFFRNPRRYTPPQENLLLAPADGTLICCGETNVLAPTDVISDSKISGQKSKRISIFLSVLDVHVNRYPCNGQVESTQYNRGKFLAAFNDKASLDNEQQATLITTKSGAKVLAIQIAGLIARRIVCYAQPNSSVRSGEYLGLIRFGSRMDLWVPAEWEILANPGQRTRGGETILAVMR